MREGEDRRGWKRRGDNGVERLNVERRQEGKREER